MINRLAFLKLVPAGSLLLSKPTALFNNDTPEAGTQNKKLIYENPLSSAKDIEGFKLEGQAKLSFENGRLRMQNELDPNLGQKSNFVFWCDQKFPDNISISYKFLPLKEPGLAMLFFAANGKNKSDLFDSSLAKREGEYQQYNRGEMNAFHIAYFRRRYDTERAFHLCNLRKSYGANMVAQGADPIPNVEDIMAPMEMRIEKTTKEVRFFINDLPILNYSDDGKTYGNFLRGGYIGFRQMAPLIAEYWDFKVFAL
ncbi:DUF1961 family protein [Pelobium manganitolerans]|uniref:DUF1961 family protein n=1 Tax=Pelobium manganitolerans TaxID=1842495 RepID=UPI003FA3BF23